MKVVVIGGGVAGLGIGWRLAQRGVEVVLLERAQPGRGATWASAGLITAKEDKAEGAGREAGFAQRSARLWQDFATEIERESGRTIAYRVDGRLVVAQTAEMYAALAAQAELGAGQMLEAEAAREIEPRLAADLAGALWDRHDARVDNRALGPALAACFVKSGGSLLLNETAVCFEIEGERIIGIRTPFALHQADAYVVAAGAWSAGIEGLPREAVPPVFPVKGEMLALQPPAGETLPRISIGGQDAYLVAQRDRLLVGATVSRAGFDTGLTEGAARWLIDRAVALMPSLRDWPVVEHWAGLRPGSPDDLPLLGRSAIDGLFIASGQYRNGILFAPAVADAMRAIVLGETLPPDIGAFDPRRFGASAAREQAPG
ncbi:MAG TPA: glycine oxidase ThiO [Rhizomicrobium sp.]|jgi:glycine oxidase|nr:glycine oxidase ThiO [Rhizomicrobium sp.]